MKPKLKSLKQPGRVLANPPSGAWLPLGHKAVPPRVTTRFGVPRFTPEQQAANPDKPMTRLVKDVLRTGSWKVGVDANVPRMWNVTRQTISEIVDNFLVGQHRGVAMNLTKSHGNVETGIVPTDDLICPIDEAVADGDTLWIATYVTPDQAADLQNPACKVSPYVMPNWMDGLGNVYSEMLLHVAVTDQPVQPGQGPFVAMANTQNQGVSTMDFAQVKALFDRLMVACGGKSLPESVDETNFITIATILVDMLAGEEAPAEEVTDLAEVAAGAEGATETAVAMNNAVKAPAWAQGLLTQVKSLSNTVNQLQQGNVAQQKVQYTAKLAALATANKISPAQRTILEQQGPAVGYALSNLQAYELNPSRPTGGRAAAALSNAQEPPVEGGKKLMTDDEHAASLAKRGLKPVAIS